MVLSVTKLDDDKAERIGVERRAQWDGPVTGQLAHPWT